MPPVTRPKLGSSNSSNSSHVASNSSNSSIVASAAPLLLLALLARRHASGRLALAAVGGARGAGAAARVTSAFERWRAARGTAPSAPPKLAPPKPALPGRRPPASPPPGDERRRRPRPGPRHRPRRREHGDRLQEMGGVEGRAGRRGEGGGAEEGGGSAHRPRGRRRRQKRRRAAEALGRIWAVLPRRAAGARRRAAGDFDTFLTVITPISWPFEFYKNATTIETGDPNDNTKNASMTIGRMTTWQKAIWSLSGLIGSAQG